VQFQTICSDWLGNVTFRFKFSIRSQRMLMERLCRKSLVTRFGRVRSDA